MRETTCGFILKTVTLCNFVQKSDICREGGTLYERLSATESFETSTKTLLKKLRFASDEPVAGVKGIVSSS